MVTWHNGRRISDEERREFLKVLGVAGIAGAGGLTLDDLRRAAAADHAAHADELAPIGRAIEADLGGTIDTELLGAHGRDLATAAGALTDVADRGVPTDGQSQGTEFTAVAAAGRPMYEHLRDIGFFESTSSHLPEFTPTYLEKCVRTFVGSEALATPLEQFGFTDGRGIDVLATVVSNAGDLEDYNWVATDALSHKNLEDVASIPPVTMGAAGGALLWLEDLDDHVWRRRVLLTEKIVGDAVWHGQSMAAGFYLMTKGAEAIGKQSSDFSNGELTALLSTGVAVQEISQSLLPQDVYWITEEMRGPRRTDLETITW
ncbi:MAG: hypothetical protein ABEJ28_12175 [Salinigranum sp.]